MVTVGLCDVEKLQAKEEGPLQAGVGEGYVN